MGAGIVVFQSDRRSLMREFLLMNRDVCTIVNGIHICQRSCLLRTRVPSRFGIRYSRDLRGAMKTRTDYSKD